MNLFGFQIKRANGDATANAESFVPPQHDDGALTLNTGSFYSTAFNTDTAFKSDVELITRYREMASQAEVEQAVEHIVNEAVVCEDSGQTVRINLDNLSADKGLKKKISDEFGTVLRLLNFNQIGHDIFRRWYIDGRLRYHEVIDDNDPKKGIIELRYIDPRRIRKIREVKHEKDFRTGADKVVATREYWLYNMTGVMGNSITNGLEVANDCIASVDSGLMDARRVQVLSYLHKAIRPLNMMRMMEDATVIYKVSRAADRRVFYIDVGSLPKTKAEQYVQSMMTKYRNKVTYDSTTGEVKDDRRFMSMMEDFWIPRRGEGKGTEIETLPGGESLANMDNVIYFQKKMYMSLNVPVGRLLPSDGFSLGRSNEITRDELAFTKFIDRLRKRFATLFDQLLGRQLSLKGICTLEEWESFRENIWYDFLKDNNFSELKEAEMLNNRLALLAMIDPFVGKYFSTKWVKKNVLRFSDELIAEMEKEIKADVETQSVALPSIHPASPFYQPPEGPEPPEQPPNIDDKFGQAMDGKGSADSAFGKLKMDEGFLTERTNDLLDRVGDSVVTPKTLNIIKDVINRRKG